MNILQLTINDVKRISAVEICPKTGEPVILTGDNAQGKSSILDSIELVLTNKGLDDPIRHGAQSAKVSAVIGDGAPKFTVTRKFKKSGAPVLEIVGADGVKIGSPQTFLNSLIGTYAFDPLEFSRLSGTAEGRRKQAEILRQLAGLDFTDLERERAELYAERTALGARGKEAAGALASVPEPLPDTPDEETSTGELLAALDALRKREKVAQVAEAEYNQASREAENASATVERLRAELAKAESDAAAAKDRQTAARIALAQAQEAAPSAEELAAAESAIRGVDGLNAAVRDKRRRAELAGQVDELRRAYAEKTAAIEAIDSEKQRRIKDANLPLEGLELADEGIIFNGTLFPQLSTAEQIRISTLVAIAQNPGLRIVMIREGALVNRENMAMVAGIAREHGVQLWVEKFQEEPGAAGLHIEDGTITHIDGQPV